MARPRAKGNGEGTLYKRPDGRWCGQYVVGWVGGKPRRITVVADTKHEADRLLSAKKRDHAEGRLAPPQRQTLAEYVAWWLANVAANRLRPRTLQSYERTLALHCLPYLGGLRLQQLAPRDLQTLYAERLASGAGARTVQYLHAVLHRALHDAERLEMVGRNAADRADPPQVEREEAPTLDLEQGRALLAAVRDTPAEGLVALALLTGLRQGELLGLRWSDVDWTVPQIAVQRTLSWVLGRGPICVPPKSKNSRRLVPLVPQAVEALRRARIRQNEQRLAAGPEWQDGDLVFSTRSGRPLSPRNVRRDWFGPALERAQLPPVRFHDLRHTAASLLLSLGVALTTVQRILGHANIGITADTYGHLLPGMATEAMRLYGEALSADELQQ
ncbi:MAG: site-specific integrase [Chloroflexi bacterium]|nr:site-specific integrase [Chloroflexota bacterium]MCL5107933.1 site-specific integrase [Chloroflexota bacterium]